VIGHHNEPPLWLLCLAGLTLKLQPLWDSTVVHVVLERVVVRLKAADKMRTVTSEGDDVEGAAPVDPRLQVRGR
jgi:hypothetical protein